MSNEQVHRPADAEKYAYVDVVRGLAILAVIAFHAGQNLQVAGFGTALNKHLLAVINTGQFGVPLFFTASAFTLMMSIDRRGMDAGPFYLRRYFRIAPMYVFGIAVYFVWNKLMMNPIGSGSEYVANVFLLHGLVPDWLNGRVPGGWSIGVEVMFYLLLPFCFRFLQSFRALLWTSLVAIVITALWHSTLPFWVQHFQSTADARGFIYAAFPNHILVFIMGAWAYYIHRNSTGVNLFIERRRWVALGGLFLWLLAAKVIGSVAYFWSPAAFAIGFAALILWLSHHLTPILNTALARVGVLSFSIYVLHFLANRTLGKGAVELGAAWLGHSLGAQVLIWGAAISVVTIASFVASEFTYRFVETPGIKLGSYLVKRCKAKVPAQA